MSAVHFITNIEGKDADKAYDLVLPEAKALPAERLVTINIDIPTAIITVVGVLPKLEVVHEQAQNLPEFEIRAFDNLPNYVLALTSAQSRYVSATTPPEQIRALLDTATEKRDIFLADAQALVARGMLSGESLKEFKGMHGYKNVAFDLMGVIQLLKTAWPTIESKTALEFEELMEANQDAMRLVSAIGHREQSPEQAAAASEIRQRIFTLFLEAYEQIRRAVIFLRWNQDDADTIAPSLYAGRVTNRKASAEAKPAVTPVPAAIVNGGAAAAPGVSTAPRIPVGMPGSDPFMQS